MRYFHASKGPRDVELGRDYFLGPRGGCKTPEEAERNMKDFFNSIVDYKIVSDEDLKDWKPRRQRLDQFLQTKF